MTAHTFWREYYDQSQERLSRRLALKPPQSEEPDCINIYRGTVDDVTPKPKIDLTGKVFGHLTVIKQVPGSDARRYSIWLCQCDCGVKSVKSGFRLRGGKTRSCGHLARKGHSPTARIPKKHNLVGKKFGKLTVISISPGNNSALSRLWLCKCSCGRECVKATRNLRCGTKSCGCLSPTGSLRSVVPI